MVTLQLDVVIDLLLYDSGRGSVAAWVDMLKRVVPRSVSGLLFELSWQGKMDLRYYLLS